jgi:hypothetical protein
MSNPIRDAIERVREAAVHHRTDAADPHAAVAGDLAAHGLNVGGMPAGGLADDVADPDVIDVEAVEAAAEAAERADLGRLG